MSYRKSINVEIDGKEFEETWELELSFTPGEKMVMYYPDGSGYPGSDPEVELISAELIERTDEDGKEVDCEGMVLNGSEWFKRARIETQKQMSAFDDWAFEKIKDEYDASYEDACEAEFDAAREEGRAPRHIRRRPFGLYR